MENKKEKRKEGIIGNALSIFLFIAVLLFGFVLKTCNGSEEKAKTTEKIGRDALVLMFDGFTPCNPTFDYKFELDTQGDPITLKFPGVDYEIYYSGKGTVAVPRTRKSGPVEIHSEVRARVRIWKVIKTKI